MSKLRPRTFFYLSVASSVVALIIAAVALWASLAGQSIDTTNFLGTLPNWITAAIALLALVAAWVSIRTQREVARKRAALDFFVKTEMDKEILDAHRRYTSGVEALIQWADRGGTIADFVKDNDEHYRSIRGYLNLHELMGVGISRGVLDDHVCYFFWSGELLTCHRDTQRLVEYIQSLPDESGTYCELRLVAERWKRRGLRSA